MALVINDRVKETSTTSGTGTISLAGAATGFVTFVAGIGDTNTTYYAIFEQGTANWEVGLGTVGDATPDTLARTTVITNSLGSTAKISFGGETADVFCTLPASRAVFGKQEGTDFTDSLLVGHSTTGTLSAAIRNVGVGIDALDALTSGDKNVAVGFGAGTAISTGGNNVAIGASALASSSGASYNIAIGDSSLALADSSTTANISIGGSAGYNIGSGNYNVLLGHTAGINVTSGSGNVIVGNIDAGSATGDKQLLIADGTDGTVNWIAGASDGNLEVTTNWNPSLSTTGKALVMGF